MAARRTTWQARHGMIGQPEHSPAAGSLDVNRAPRRPSGSGARTQVADAAAPGRPGQWLECRDRPDQHLHQRGAVPDHTHEVEEVLLVTAGEGTVIVDGRPEAARTADAVIIKPR